MVEIGGMEKTRWRRKKTMGGEGKTISGDGKDHGGEGGEGKDHGGDGKDHGGEGGDGKDHGEGGDGKDHAGGKVGGQVRVWVGAIWVGDHTRFHLGKVWRYWPGRRVLAGGGWPISGSGWRGWPWWNNGGGYKKKTEKPGN
ncbi:hypothetical protein Tco_1185960 [Tanacetum coccineum]